MDLIASKIQLGDYRQQWYREPSDESSISPKQRAFSTREEGHWRLFFLWAIIAC